jgi:hypothetical protein
MRQGFLFSEGRELMCFGIVNNIFDIKEDTK